MRLRGIRLHLVSMKMNLETHFRVVFAANVSYEHVFTENRSNKVSATFSLVSLAEGFIVPDTNCQYFKDEPCHATFSCILPTAQAFHYGLTLRRR